MTELVQPGTERRSTEIPKLASAYYQIQNETSFSSIKSNSRRGSGENLKSHRCFNQNMLIISPRLSSGFFFVNTSYREKRETPPRTTTTSHNPGHRYNHLESNICAAQDITLVTRILLFHLLITS